ncbi:MAG: hypothetical protein ACFFD2_27275, partial [Promethearchaeota archaeon]
VFTTRHSKHQTLKNNILCILIINKLATDVEVGLGGEKNKTHFFMISKFCRNNKTHLKTYS